MGHKVDVIVSKISPSYVDIQFQSNHIPRFVVNAYKASTEGNLSQFYIIRSGNFKSDETLVLETIPSILRQKLRLKAHGALEYVLQSWTGIQTDPITHDVIDDLPIKPKTFNKSHDVPAKTISTKNISKSKRNRRNRTNSSPERDLIRKALQAKSTENKEMSKILSEYDIELLNPKIGGQKSMMNVIIESLKMYEKKAPPITIIHGPPGTGKSTITGEIVYQICSKYFIND